MKNKASFTGRPFDSLEEKVLRNRIIAGAKVFIQNPGIKPKFKKIKKTFFVVVCENAEAKIFYDAIQAAGIYTEITDIEELLKQSEYAAKIGYKKYLEELNRNENNIPMISITKSLNIKTLKK
jgi:hypothetical protein